MGIVVEEADETVFWLELLVDAQVMRQEQLADILAEANELLAIFAASQRTAKSTNATMNTRPAEQILQSAIPQFPNAPMAR